MFDACHMIKLARNCIENQGSLKSNGNMAIEWVHFQRLEAARIKQDFSTHKLTKKHIQCDRNKMSVPLAVQTLSKSVAESLHYLMEAGVHGFKNCAGTIEYASIFNDLFDIMNTDINDTQSNNQNNIFKVPLCEETAPQVFSYFDKCSDYIESLKLDGKPILQSKRKTGFLGFLIDIISVKSIFRVCPHFD